MIDARPVFMQATKQWGVRVMDPNAKAGDQVRVTNPKGPTTWVSVLDSPGPLHRDGGTCWHIRPNFPRAARGPRRDPKDTLAMLDAYRRGALGGMDPDDPLGEL